ncbi:carbon-nitrogen hydrolase family protein [Chloroflexota bacterium]
MKIWLVQMAPKLGDIKANTAKIIDYVDKAAEAEVQLIAFPELTLTGYMLRQKFSQLAEPLPGPVTEPIARRARKYQMYVTLGMPELYHDQVYNSAPLFGPDGLVGVCRKLFLPAFVAPSATFEEDRFFKPGYDIVTFDTSFGKLGIQICYDFHFPEIARAQALQGASLLLNLSAAPIPASDKTPPGYVSAPERFQLLARARAVENQAYFGYVNRVGIEEDVIFGGGTCLANNKGQLEKSLSLGEGAGEEVAECEIDMEKLRRARLALPILKDVRPEIMRRAAEIADSQ